MHIPSQIYLNCDTKGDCMYISIIEEETTHHCLRSSGELRMRAAMRAPWMGGLEYMGRMRILIWDITRLASSTESQTSVKAPTRSPKTASKWPRFKCSTTTTTQKACFSPYESPQNYHGHCHTVHFPLKSFVMKMHPSHSPLIIEAKAVHTVKYPAPLKLYLP